MRIRPVPGVFGDTGSESTLMTGTLPVGAGSGSAMATAALVPTSVAGTRCGSPLA